jgi:pyruvate kinase
MTKENPINSIAKLMWSNAQLRLRLEEAEETLRAIRAGEVDGLWMEEQVCCFEGVKTPYRRLIKAINEGAATLLDDGAVLIAVLIPGNGKTAISAMLEKVQQGKRIQQCETIRLKKGATFYFSLPRSCGSTHIHDPP